MLSLFRRLSLRHLAAHKLRTVMTLTGIAFGVGSILAMWLLNDSCSRAFEDAIDQLAGRAQLQITNGQSGVPEQVLDDLSRIPGIATVAPTVQGFMQAASIHGERVYVFGIDMLADAQVRDYQTTSSAALKDPLVFLAQPDSVALTASFLKAAGLKEGDRFSLKTTHGRVSLKIRGTLKVDRGPAAIFDGRLALMDVFAAEKLFGLDHRFTEIDIVPRRGVDLDQLQGSIERAIAGRASVERPAMRDRAMQKMLDGQRSALAMAGILALIVGVYLVFNTMLISVTQRRREIGILRATGMRRIEVVRLIAAEALLNGLVGSALGVATGVWLTKWLLPSFSAAALYASGAVGMVSRPQGLGLTGRLDVISSDLAFAIALGVSSSLVAAILPAIEAVRITPAEALRPLGTDDEAPSAFSAAARVGAACIAVALLAWGCGAVFGVAPGAVGVVVQIGLLLGLSFVTPAAVRALALRLGESLSLSSAPMAALAARSIVANLRRVSISAAALAVGLAGAVQMSVVMASVQRTIEHQIQLGFSRVDFLISTGHDFDPARSAEWLSLPSSLRDDMAAVPGVAKVGGERVVIQQYEGLPVAMTVDDENSGTIRQFEPIEGRLAQAGSDETFVSEVFAAQHRKHVGDLIALDSPTGTVDLRIAGIGFDMSQGWIWVPRELYIRRWKDNSFNQLLVALKPDVDREAVARAIRDKFGDQYGISVLDVSKFLKNAVAGIAAIEFAAYPVAVLTILISLIGIVISLVTTVLDRVREIGVLRATVATRGQVASLVMLEAAAVGLTGGALGIAAGSLTGYAYVRQIFPSLFYWAPLYRYPAGAAVFALIAAVVLSACAGYFPGRSAARVKIREALTYE